jgi:hypothetical protein
VSTIILDDETKDWRNMARNCERVRAGDKIAVQVQGGWVSKPAPWDGYVFVSGEVNIYVPTPLLKKRKPK